MPEVAVEIPIWNRAREIVGIAVIDAADAELVRSYRWRLQKGYARGYKNGQSVFMHRLFLGNLKGGLQTDHINRNRLDNRRCNLRACSPAQNSQNLYPRGSVNARGVTFEHGKWLARVQRHRDKTLFRKSYSKLSDAIDAVKKARATHFTYSEEALCQ